MLIFVCARTESALTLRSFSWIKISSRPIPCHSHNLLWQWLRNWLRVFWRLRLPGVSLLACSISLCPRLFWWLRALGPIGMQRVSVDDRKWKEKKSHTSFADLWRVRGAPGQSNFNTGFFTASYVMDVVPNVCCSLVPHQKKWYRNQPRTGRAMVLEIYVEMVWQISRENGAKWFH